MDGNEMLLLIGASAMAAALIGAMIVLLWHRIAKKRLNEKLNKEFGKRWN